MLLSQNLCHQGSKHWCYQRWCYFWRVLAMPSWPIGCLLPASISAPYSSFHRTSAASSEAQFDSYPSPVWEVPSISFRHPWFLYGSSWKLWTNFEYFPICGFSSFIHFHEGFTFEHTILGLDHHQIWNWNSSFLFVDIWKNKIKID